MPKNSVGQKKREENSVIFKEDEKAVGNGGTKNEGGDFIYQELRQKACEFLGLE